MASLVQILPLLFHAQGLLDPTTVGGKLAVDRFERDFALSTPRLACSVNPLPPMLSFTFRHQAGYRIAVPVSELTGQGGFLTVRFRVTQRDRNDNPLYLQQLFRLPVIPPEARGQAMFSGGYFVGEGAYHVDWMMSDQSGRYCRTKWDFKLKLSNDERQIKQLTPAGFVEPLRLRRWRDPASATPRPYRVAVLLHAAPLFPRTTVLSDYDQILLVSILQTLFDETPFTPASLTVFSLHHQRELFHARQLTRANLRQLLRSIDDLQLGTIDVSQLRNPRGALDLLAQMINREIAGDSPPDAVIFIGPNNFYNDKFPDSKIENVPHKPPFFYLHEDFYARIWPWDDSIEKLTKSQGGRVFKITHPRQLAAALVQIEEALAKTASHSEPRP